MNLPPWLKVLPDGEILLSLKVQPRASKNEIGGAVGNELKIKVTAPPVDSAANEALVELLAEKLKSPKGAVRIIRGATSRHKIVGLRGLQPDSMVRLLLSQS